MLAIFKHLRVCINCIPITLHEKRKQYHDDMGVRDPYDYEVQEVVDSILARPWQLDPDNLCGEGMDTAFLQGFEWQVPLQKMLWLH